MFENLAGDVPAGDVPAGDVPAGDVPAGAVRLAAVLGPRPRRPLPAGLLPQGDSARMELARLQAAPPGPELAGRLVTLGGALSDPGSRLTLLALWDRCASWVSAQQQTVLAAVAGAEPEPEPDGSSSDDWVREDVGCALRLSPAAANRRIELARRLDGALRPARDALGSGALTFLHALTLTEQVRDLPDHAARAVASRVLPGAEATSLGAFRKAVTRAVVAVDPEALETAQLRSRRERRVERWRGPDGAAVLAATGPAVESELIYTALTAAAQAARKASPAAGGGAGGGGGPAGSGGPAGGGAAGKPTLDALRYDTLVGWARAALTGTEALPGPDTNTPDTSTPDTSTPDTSTPDTSTPDTSDPGAGARATSTRATSTRATSTPDTGDLAAGGSAGSGGSSGSGGSGGSAGQPAGPRLDIGLIIDLPTLLGLAENPAEIAGYGPIPAALARELAADGRWRRLVTDPVTGHLLDYGRRHYQPPAALADFITARDRTCRFPHCTQPASRCDQDHHQPWDPGGNTSAANIHSLCRRHHRLKTFTRWRYQPQPDGSTTWTSPTGHTTTDPIPVYTTG